MRGGSPIANATGATYTPVAADLNKALMRKTFGANIAGNVTVQTAPIVVQAAAAGQDGVLDFLIPGNPLAAAI